MIKTSQEAKDWVKAHLDIDGHYETWHDNDILSMEMGYDAGIEKFKEKLIAANTSSDGLWDCLDEEQWMDLLKDAQPEVDNG